MAPNANHEAPMATFLLYRAGGMRGAIEFGRSPALAWARCQDSFVQLVFLSLSKSVKYRLNSLPGPQRIPPALLSPAIFGHLGDPKIGSKMGPILGSLLEEFWVPKWAPKLSKNLSQTY